MLKKRLRQLIHTPFTSGLFAFSKLQTSLFKGKKYVVIACMPKTGSTFLNKVLVELTGYQYQDLCSYGKQNEPDIYLPVIVDAFRFKSITQQHMRATDGNLNILNSYSISPIILVRNIFDIVVSIRDHLHKESILGFILHLNEEFFKLDEETQLDMIIEMALPWYFNFMASWHDACSSGRISALWMTYERLFADKPIALRTILDFYGMQFTDKEIESALNNTIGKQGTRLNKGVPGRGQDILTEEQKMKIISYARFYPYVDFSLIGINKSDS